MLDSVPVPLQAILWPLLGAAFVLVTWRLLPNWLLRMAAMAAALASLLTLHSLVIDTAPLTLQAIESVEASWEPVNLFRLGPSLRPDGLSLVMGITLSGTVAAAVLGIRGSEPKRTVWHALILVTLSGFLVLSMSANLLTLALGSALLDLSLLAMAVSAPEDAERSGSEPGLARIAWRMAVPGMISTLVILLSALQMSVEAGTASLWARDLAALPSVLLIVAGMLRMLVYPLHPRGLRTPEGGITFLLLANAGLFLVLRAQATTPVPDEPGRVLLVGLIAFLAGALLAWTGAIRSRKGQGDQSAEGVTEPQRGGLGGPDHGWLGVAINQSGYALAFLLLVAASQPWPLISMTIAASMLAIWWDGTSRSLSDPDASGLEDWQASVKAHFGQWLPASGDGQASRIARYACASLPAIALASLAGLPLTVGALGRWPFYAALLHSGQATQLLIVVVADTLLAAALWTALRSILRQTTHGKPGAAALLALAVLALVVIIVGVAPGHLGLERVEPADASLWSLGILYVLPWLIGGWLARLMPRLGRRAGQYAARIYQIAALDWAYQAANWAGQQVLGAVHWLGRVGEGEGWWGWALIILLLGAMLLTLR